MVDRRPFDARNYGGLDRAGGRLPPASSKTCNEFLRGYDLRFVACHQVLHGHVIGDKEVAFVSAAQNEEVIRVRRAVSQIAQSCGQRLKSHQKPPPAGAVFARQTPCYLPQGIAVAPSSILPVLDGGSSNLFPRRDRYLRALRLGVSY